MILYEQPDLASQVANKDRWLLAVSALLMTLLKVRDPHLCSSQASATSLRVCLSPVPNGPRC